MTKVEFEFPFKVGDHVALRTVVAQYLAEAANVSDYELAIKNYNPGRLPVLEISELRACQCHGGTQGFALLTDERGSSSIIVPGHAIVPHAESVAEVAAAFQKRWDAVVAEREKRLIEKGYGS